MNSIPFPFQDFLRAKQQLLQAFADLHDPFVLLTGDTGVGKTALLRQLRSELDRTRYRVVYFPEARKLGAAGLVKVLGECLRVPTSMCHSVSFERLLRTLADEPQVLLLWLDEGHELPQETFAELRALAEADLGGERRIQVSLLGLPRLRASLQAQTHLWRRLFVREQITGLLFDELAPFLEHHFSSELNDRLCQIGRTALFERAKGRPGLLLPMARALFNHDLQNQSALSPALIEDILDQWDLA